MSKQSDNEYGTRQRAGLFLGPTDFLLFLPIPIPDGLADEAWAVAGVTPVYGHCYNQRKWLGGCCVWKTN